MIVSWTCSFLGSVFAKDRLTGGQGRGFSIQGLASTGRLRYPSKPLSDQVRKVVGQPQHHMEIVLISSLMF